MKNNRNVIFGYSTFLSKKRQKPLNQKSLLFLEKIALEQIEEMIFSK
jgi:hypothetical protein